MHLPRGAGYRSAWNFRISRPPPDSFGADAPGERALRPATRGHPFHSGYRRVSTASSVLGYAGVVTLACDGYSNRSCRALAYARPRLRFFGSFPSSCLRSYDPQSRGFIADPPRAFFVLLALIPTSERRSYEDCRRLRASSGKL